MKRQNGKLDPYVRIEQRPGRFQSVMILVLVVLAIELYAVALLSASVRAWVVTVGVVLLTTATFALLGHYCEPIKGAKRTQRLRNIFNPKIQSWAFLADMFGLAPALGFAVAGRGQIHTWAFHQWWWFVVVSPVVGIAFSLGFHWFLDRPPCLEENPNALRSPTKVWHNWCTYPVLFSSMVAFCVPYLWSRHDRFWWVLGFTLVWVAGMAFDAVRGMISPEWRLSARKLHIPWDEAACRPLAY